MAPRTTMTLQSGLQTYENTVARDNATAIYGNIYENVVFNNGPPNNEKSDREKAIKCRDTLFLTDPEDDRATLISAKGKRVATTCEWIRENETYCDWLERKTSLLWICGGPGKGKTMLSIFLTQELEVDNEVLYFFCTAGDEKRNKVTAILRGLIWQLIDKRRELATEIIEYFETETSAQATLSSLERLWSGFVRILKSLDSIKIFCVIDGLDECDPDSIKWLADKLEDVGSSSSQIKNLQLVIVSRPLVNLRALNTIMLDPDNDEEVSHDIKTFVSVKVQKLSQVIAFDANFRDKIEKTLLERAEGTFLWVGFAMDELFRKQTQLQIEEAVGSLPRALPGLYSRMLRQIDPEKREISAQIIQWATLAIRPLSVSELASALAISSSPLTSAEQAMRDQIDICRPLVRVSEGGDEVVLVHQSARDYLLRENPDDDPVLERFRIKFEEAHLEIAEKCVDCLIRMQADLERLYNRLDNNGDPVDEHSPTFFSYSVDYWPDHTRMSGALARPLITKSEFFSRRATKLQQKWWSKYRRSRGCPYSKYHGDPMNLACLLGITPWIQILMEGTWNRMKYRRRFNHRHSERFRYTPLQFAASVGHLSTVQLLINSGAKVDVKNKYEGTALHLAFIYENQAIAQELIAHGAHVNEVSRWGTCLTYATDSRNDTMVRFAIASGANVNAPGVGWEENTALHIAACHGSDSIVRILLESGADVHAKNAWRRTPLHETAFRSGSQETARLLLEYGAMVNAIDENGTTPLHMAAEHGRVGFVKLLLDHGANRYLKDDDGATARSLAVSKNHEEIVTLLDTYGIESAPMVDPP